MALTRSRYALAENLIIIALKYLMCLTQGAAIISRFLFISKRKRRLQPVTHNDLQGISLSCLALARSGSTLRTTTHTKSNLRTFTSILSL
jgi:hypothetical protein